MAKEKTDITEELTEEQEKQLQEDQSVQMRSAAYKAIGQVSDLLSKKQDNISEVFSNSVIHLLGELKESMERGRIRSYEDLLMANTYLTAIRKAVEEDDIEDLEKEVTDFSKIFDRMKTRHWYVVNTYSGHENRVKENLERRVETMGIEDNLFQILVAEEEEIEIRKDKKVTKMKNLYPGYLFVEMIMTDEAWYIVRNTPGVTGFIGSSGGGAKPFPVSDEEIESILRRIGMTDSKIVANFEVGDIVKILNGPFRGIEGTVESMNNESAKADIITIMFGRETTTTVDYLDLQKAD